MVVDIKNRGFSLFSAKKRFESEKYFDIIKSNIFTNDALHLNKVIIDKTRDVVG